MNQCLKETILVYLMQQSPPALVSSVAQRALLVDRLIYHCSTRRLPEDIFFRAAKMLDIYLCSKGSLPQYLRQCTSLVIVFLATKFESSQKHLSVTQFCKGIDLPGSQMLQLQAQILQRTNFFQISNGHYQVCKFLQDRLQVRLNFRLKEQFAAAWLFLAKQVTYDSNFLSQFSPGVVAISIIITALKAIQLATNSNMGYEVLVHYKIQSIQKMIQRKSESRRCERLILQSGSRSRALLGGESNLNKLQSFFISIE